MKFLKIRGFGLGDVHKIEQILVTGNNEPGTSRNGKIDIMRVIVIPLISEDRWKPIKQGRGNFNGLEKLFNTCGEVLKLLWVGPIHHAILLESKVI